MFDDDGLLSWRVLRLRNRWSAGSAILAPACGRRGVTIVLALRLAMAAVLTLPVGNAVRLAALVAIVLTGWLLRQRRWLSHDGSDQMGQTVAIGAAILALGLVVRDPGVAFAGVLLIAGQLCIAYFIGGVAKLVSPEWRSGRALIGVMGTHAFGHGFAARVASSRTRFARAFCWALMIVETAFPLAIMLDANLFCVVLLVFASFHLATALFMGLNTYVWSFLAAYPAALAMNSVVSSALGGG